jgi:hypothetical protein
LNAKAACRNRRAASFCSRSKTLRDRAFANTRD